ncbi:MAG: SLC13 family permease [Pseudomonadota bacterium]|nr:SLC13 family permease [Gammaproteobacteria bacterium]MEE2684219.1 SLC13 family permease [Pseudomonadota bacterium]|tara:strand:- start:12588 stop:14402 length:1815 start_codon:yes stop_codon:yes gene_type:complete
MLSIDIHIIFVLLLTPLALYLFTRDKVPLEASSLSIILILMLFFQFFPYINDGSVLSPIDFIAGFGNEAVITIGALMIIGKGIEKTGAIQPLASLLASFWKNQPKITLLLTLVFACLLSGFINNTPVVIILLPMLIGVAIRSKSAPSLILMPIGFATLIGGMSTTIGTSTNLLIVNIAREHGVIDFGMFDFAVPVMIVGFFGLLYLWLIAPKLLPEREQPLSDISPRVFEASFYIQESSKASNLPFSDILELTNNEMKVDRIERGEGLIVVKLPSVLIQDGDRLIVRDTPENLKRYEEMIGAKLHSHVETKNDNIDQQHLAEIVITRGSLFHRSTLLESNFSQQTGLLPLALNQVKESGIDQSSGDINSAQLRAGDILLIQGSDKKIKELKSSGKALVLDGSTDLPRTHRATRAIAILIGVVFAAATGILPISLSSVLGVAALLATRCLNWQEAIGSVSIQIIMVIVASLALGIAMTETGAALLIAQYFSNSISHLPIPIILSALILLMSILSNFLSNVSTGIIGTPIAIQMALQLGADPVPFILAVIFGANMSFGTPYGYQTNLLIFSAGGYKFKDFIKAGIPLIILMWIGFSLILPIIYKIY